MTNLNSKVVHSLEILKFQRYNEFLLLILLHVVKSYGLIGDLTDCRHRNRNCFDFFLKKIRNDGSCGARLDPMGICEQVK